jgi:hypothetical protein
MKRIIIALLILGFSALFIFYGIVCWLIFSDVKEITQIAQQRFKGDAVEATIAMLQSKETSFVLKNKAVYALGQIGDKRALPALRHQVTGIPCPKPCTKHNYICQYELEKAIKTCDGGFTVTRWMYRFL